MSVRTLYDWADEVQALEDKAAENDQRETAEFDVDAYLRHIEG